MSAPYERDALCCPLRNFDDDGIPTGYIEATNNRLVVVEDPGGTDTELLVDLDAGRYFIHDSEDLHSTTDVDGGEYRGLYYAVSKLLTDGTTAGVGTLTGSPSNDSYSFEVITPGDSAGYVDGGVRIRATKAGGAVPFRLRFYQDLMVTPWSTVDGRWFGSKAQSGYNHDSEADGDDQILEMPGAILGRLATQQISPTGRAADKRRIPYKDSRSSVPIPRDARQVEWDAGHRRRLVYTNVWGALVYERRPAESAFASIAQLDTNDFNFSWEHVWEALMDGERLLVAHNNADDFDVTAHSYEVGKLHSPNDEEMLGNFARVTGDNGDFHTISFKLWVDPDFAEYDH